MKFGTLLSITLLSMCAACGGGGSGNSDSKPETQNNITYCVTNEATQDAFSFSKKPIMFSSQGVSRETDVLVEQLPSDLSDITSNFLYVSYTDLNGSPVDVLYKPDDSNLSLQYGFSLTASNNSGNNIYINLPVLMHEGWLFQGRYIDHESLSDVSVVVDNESLNCDSTSEATVLVDKIEYIGGRLSFVDFRFAVKCSLKKIYGRASWSNDVPPATEPGVIPSDYWQPASPIKNNQLTHLYFIDQRGNEFFYTQSDSVFNVQTLKETLGSIQVQFDVKGSVAWTGSIFTFPGVGKLTPGLYDNSISWTYNGILIHAQPGNELSGWPVCNVTKHSYVIDKSEYSDSGDLELFDMRFEFICEDGTSAHGRFLWDKNDQTHPPGPAQIPEGLWDIHPERTLNDGNYLYIEGDEGEFISQGLTYEYDYDNAQFLIEYYNNRFINFKVLNDTFTNLNLVAMSSVDKFEKGFYGPYKFFDNSNPALGFHKFSMERGTSHDGGWYVIDHIVYEGDLISEIIVRFEYVADYLGRAVRGKLFWSKNSMLKPTNPKMIPNNQWESPIELQNSCGNKNTLRLQIQYNSWWNRAYGLGASESMPVYAVFDNIIGGYFKYEDSDTWQVIFSAQTPGKDYRKLDGMALHINGTYLQKQLEVGFYDDIWGRNPAKGSIDLSLDGYGCIAKKGWMAVDEIVYGANSELTKINLRFGFSCDSEVVDSTSIYGELNWQK